MRRLTRRQAQIKVDLDECPGDPPREIMLLLLRRAGYTVLREISYRSPSGEGWHLKFDVTPLPQHPYEVVALQAMLGSDPYREAMQMHRAKVFFISPQWMRNLWNVLYSPHLQRERHLNLEKRIPWEPPS